ncbi:MAG: Ig-like domain-containing protein [Paludibacteraceae bacterium]|nr:Ig-like domain-containing protein [Paludibacteraceae bacterium]
MKHLYLHLPILFIVLALTACKEDEPVYGTTVLSSIQEVSIQEGKTITLQTNNPQDFAGDDLVWFSSDESVATVESGIVTGLKAGSTTVFVTRGNKKLKQYTVWVFNSKKFMNIDGKKYPITYVNLNTTNADHGFYEILFCTREVPDYKPQYAYAADVPSILLYFSQTMMFEEIDFSVTPSTDYDNLHMEVHNYAGIQTLLEGSYFEEGSFAFLPSGSGWDFSLNVDCMLYDSNTGEQKPLTIIYTGGLDFHGDW